MCDLLPPSRTWTVSCVVQSTATHGRGKDTQILVIMPSSEGFLIISLVDQTQDRGANASALQVRADDHTCTAKS